MPSRSPSQHRLMNAVAHSAEFARKVGISRKVGKEFVAADKRQGESNAGSRKFTTTHRERTAVIERIVARRRRAGV